MLCACEGCDYESRLSTASRKNDHMSPIKMKVSKTPVPARRGLSPRPMRSRIQRILATTDFSDESLAGVRYALSLAERLKAAVALLHVIEPPSRIAGMEAVVLAREDSEVRELARAQLKMIAARETKGDLKVTSLLRIGSPFHEITKAAREAAADLIVIATHGYTGARRVLLGSTAERVVRHAQCPVLVVRDRKAKSN